MLTRARRVCSFTIANDRGGNGYGFPMRLTSKLSDFVAFTEGGAGCLIERILPRYSDLFWERKLLRQRVPPVLLELRLTMC